MNAKVFLTALIAFWLSLGSVQAIEISGFQPMHLTKVQDTGKCSELILKSGEIIKVNVQKITEFSVEYVKCGTNSPVYTVSKSKVLSIRYPDGTVEKLTSETASTNTGKTGAIISFVLSLIGLIIFPFLLGITAVIWGISSLAKLNKSGAKGKGFAIAAIVIGAIDVIASLILALALLSA